MKYWRKYLYQLVFIFLILAVIGMFYPFFLYGKLPIPTDSLVGLYNPWRDFYAHTNPSGITYKNPLTTDPVLQQFPYRVLAIAQLKSGQFPTKNIYAFSGTPLFANVQTALLYPLNIVFWLFHDGVAWSILVISQPLLAGLFLYLYLKNKMLHPLACFLGSFSFAFCGFMVAWLEWNTLGHVIVWLPLLLLSIDNLIERKNTRWIFVFIFSLVASIFAGHFQTLAYEIFFIGTYTVVFIGQKYNWQFSATATKLLPFIIFVFAGLIVAGIQLVPAALFIKNSARSSDLSDWRRPDWFLPPQHLVQLFAPDFFGNPATNNYWGIWNYGEFVNYIGMAGLFFSFYSLLWRRSNTTHFFTGMFLLALLLALPTPVAQLPYKFEFPFIATLQPSRIMVIAQFSLAVLAAFGLDFFLQNKFNTKKLFICASGLITVLTILWLIVFSSQQIRPVDLITARRNLILPTVTLGSIIILVPLLRMKNVVLQIFGTGLLLSIVILDQGRFMSKYTSFSSLQLLYPKTGTLVFLEQNIGLNRVLTTDRRILPPNVSSYYRIASVDGYDPLYLRRYGDLVAAWTRNKADLSQASFNRILTPQNPDSPFTDFLGVKYILSFTPMKNPKFKLVFSEGDTQVYENSNAYPRTFLAEEIQPNMKPQEIVSQLFSNSKLFTRKAWLENSLKLESTPLKKEETAIIDAYTASHMVLSVQAAQPRLLVITDIYDQYTKSFIDGIPTPTLAVDYFFTGVLVPSGKHQVTLQW